MGFWIPLAIFIGTTILGALFRPRVKKPAAVIGPSPGDLQYPTTDDGPVVVPFGTCYIRQPTLLWEKKIPAVPIIEDGSTVGHKFYAGLQLGVCHGPIDRLDSIRFNDKPIGASIDAGSNKIVFGFTAPWAVAEIPPTNYVNGGALAIAIEGAMRTALPGDWKASFAFQVDAGRNDMIRIDAVDLSSSYQIRATIPPGIYTSGAYATAVAAALNAWGSPIGWSAAFDGANKLVITGTGALGFIFLGGDSGIADFYTRSANASMGFLLHLSKPSTGSTVTADYAVPPNRFVIAYAGTTGVLKLTDPGFTAAAALGFSTSADAGLLLRVSDSNFTVITATYTDAGDYIQVDVNDPTFFGTDGGVQGRIDFYKGGLTQAGSSYLTTEQGIATPPYPGLCHMVARDIYIGNSNYLKPFGAEV